jgi:hypothetical protein
MRILISLAALAFAACTPAAREAAEPAAPPTEPLAPGGVTHASLSEMHDALDWQHGRGAELQEEYAATAKQLLVGKPRPDVMKQIEEAGYSCIFGEAHEKYPDPGAQCTRSFATRACQMDWEIFTTAADGKADSADATYKRDCVGTADDYPEPIESAIDNQLAPQTPPAAPN